MDPVKNAADDRRIPLVELPLTQGELAELLERVDAVFVSHLHRDHWDAAARELVPARLPVFCQPGDEAEIRRAGFGDVRPVVGTLAFGGVEIARTGGQHGRGEIGAQMGAVSGFVLQAAAESTLYLAGDSIWCPEVERAIADFHPDVTVVHAGAAQFLTGGPITMDAPDVVSLCRARASMAVVAVHFESVNHCLLTRAALAQAVADAGVAGQVRIPLDGETLELAGPPGVRYEVVLTVEPALAPAVERFMVETHIPDMHATGCFRSIEFARAGDGRFRTSYEAATQAELDRYLAQHAPRLRAHFAAHFPAGVSASRDVWVRRARCS
jgi:L-ascorbate metabolism protein UlaG (beta-lactamase superfamily)